MLNRLFRLSDHGTTPTTEILAGASTFLTMAFIIAVNPAILSDAGMDFGAAFIATILATVIGTLIMGLYAGWPVAVAPGMGLNAYFAYAVILGYGLSWQQALALLTMATEIEMRYNTNIIHPPVDSKGFRLFETTTTLCHGIMKL